VDNALIGQLDGWIGPTPEISRPLPMSFLPPYVTGVLALSKMWTVQDVERHPKSVRGLSPESDELSQHIPAQMIPTVHPASPPRSLDGRQNGPDKVWTLLRPLAVHRRGNARCEGLPRVLANGSRSKRPIALPRSKSRSADDREQSDRCPGSWDVGPDVNCQTAAPTVISYRRSMVGNQRMRVGSDENGSPCHAVTGRVAAGAK
jgi:hypothetical protein